MAEFQRLLEIQQMLHPRPSVGRLVTLTHSRQDLINPHRFFVREGPLLLWNQKRGKKSKRYFFLFNDILLLTKKQGKKRFWLRIHISLRSSNVDVEDVPSSNFYYEFRLHCRTRSFVLYAEYEEEKDAWVSDLRNSIKGEHPSELQAKKDKEIIKREREKEEEDVEKDKVKDKERRRSQMMEAPATEKKEAHKKKHLTTAQSKPRSASVNTLPPRKHKSSSGSPSSQPRASPSPSPSPSTQAHEPRKKKIQSTTGSSTLSYSTPRPQTQVYSAAVPIDADDSIKIYASTNNATKPLRDIPTTQPNPFLTLPSPAGPSPTLQQPLPNPFVTNTRSPFLTNTRPLSGYYTPPAPATTTTRVNPYLTNPSNPYPTLSLSSPSIFTTNSAAPNPFMTNPNPRLSMSIPTSVNPFLTNTPAGHPQPTVGQAQHVPGPFTAANTPSVGTGSTAQHQAFLF